MIRDEETHIPRILQHIEPCDLTKADMVDWVWKRLIAAIRAPTGPMVEDSSIELEQSLKEVRFPTQQRRLKSDSGTTSGSRKTGRSRRQTEPLSITGISNDSSSGTIPCPTETLSKRRISSFGGRTSKDSYVPGANCSSTSPAVSNLPRPPASPSIPINVKQNQQVIEALPNINSTESVVPEPTAPDLV